VHRPSTARSTGPLPRNRAGWLALAALTLVTLVCFAGAFWAWQIRQHAPLGEHLLAPACAILAAAAIAQLATFWRAHRVGKLALLQSRISDFAFWRRLSLVAASAYAIALVLGPRPNLGWAWCAAIAAAYSIMLLPLTASPRVLDSWRHWSRSRFGRGLSWLVPAALALAIVAETGLRALRYLDEQSWGDPMASGQVNSTTALSDAELDFQFIMAGDHWHSGPFRVAVAMRQDVGNSAQDGYLARVRQMLPGVETIALEVPPSWSRRTSTKLVTDARKQDADLLLVVLPVCELVTGHEQPTDWFDWRQLELARPFGSAPCADVANDCARTQASAGDFEAFLAEQGPQLTACRSPISDVTHRRWAQIHGAIDTLASRCHAQGMPLALVLAPGEFQVNTRLVDVLVRRSG
jgi:hypothetical protein